MIAAPHTQSQPDTNDGLTSIDRVRLALAMMDTGSSWDLEPEYAEDLLTAYDALQARVDDLTKALSEIEAKTNGDRLTVSEKNAFYHWQQLNTLLIDIRTRCRSALSLEDRK